MGITALIILAALAPSALPSKQSVSVLVDDRVRCQWTSIQQSGEQSRVLYRDDVGHMLVIRQAPDARKPTLSRMSIEDRTSGEALVVTTDTAAGRVTFELGGSRMTLDRSTLEARMKSDAAEFKAEGAALASKSSLAFQDALKRLAVVGCADNELRTPVLLYSTFLYPRSVCNGLPPVKVETSNPVERFSAKAVEPSEFEQQFGRNYYE